MPNYKVLINDNARYMDESERALIMASSATPMGP